MPVISGLFNVVVAWDKGADEEQTKMVEGFFKKALTIKRDNGFATDDEHITFLEKREDVDRYVEEGKCDALIVSESLDGAAIGTGAIKAWKNARKDMKILLVMNNNKRGSGKAQGLYKMSYYRGLFIEDFSPSNVFELLCSNRAPMEAFEYYGVGYYRDKNEYNTKKDDVKPVEVSVKEETLSSEDAKAAADEKNVTDEGSSKKKDKKSGDSSKKESSKKNKDSKKEEKKESSKKSESKKASKEVKEEKASGKKKASKKKEEVSEENTEPSAAEKIAEDVISGAEEGRPDVEALLAESESYFEGDLGSEYFDIEDADEGLSSYAEIPESGDGSDIDDSSAFDLLIPADIFEEEASVDEALAGSDEDALAYIRARETEAFAPSEIYYEPNTFDELCEQVLTHYTIIEPQNLSNLEQGIMSPEEFEHELKQYLNKFEIDEDTLEAVKANFYEFMWGYDIITPFINDPTISDIKLEAPNRIRIKRHGKRYFSKVVFRSENHYKSFISHIARMNHVNMQDGRPDKTFMDTTTSEFCRMRFVLSTEYINSNNFPTLVIRKVPNQKYTVENLVSAGMMSPKTAAFLVSEVRKGKSFLVTGTMASGKTTWMNTMLDYISHNKSVLAIQENEELFSNVHPDNLFQRIQVNDDGELTYDLRYLSTFGLLMDVDYFMIGEIKGGEAKQFVDAVYSNTVCWASLHCPSSKDALPRVADLAKFASDYSEEALVERLATGIDYVVYLEKFKVMEISRVKGYDRKKKEVMYEEIELW